MNNRVVGLLGDVQAQGVTTPEPSTRSLCLATGLASVVIAFVKKRRGFACQWGRLCENEITRQLNGPSAQSFVLETSKKGGELVCPKL